MHASWLYQMALYSAGARDRTAVVIHPTLSADAREHRIRVQDPLTGAPRGAVVVRPLPLGEVADALAAGVDDRTTTLRALARRLTGACADAA